MERGDHSYTMVPIGVSRGSVFKFMGGTNPLVNRVTQKGLPGKTRVKHAFLHLYYLRTHPCLNISISAYIQPVNF